VLLLHAFPELAYSWRNQIGPIADAGLRVVAPNQRGFAGCDPPADSQTYSVRNLVRDISGLLDALDVEQAIWVGHDWARCAWHAGAYAPERVLGAASLWRQPSGWRARVGSARQVSRRLLELSHQPAQRLSRIGMDGAGPLGDQGGPGLEALELRAALDFVKPLALAVEEDESSEVTAVWRKEPGVKALDLPVLLELPVVLD
jgi:pimeloyl-ACP methyl ester carboxylesterase